MTDRWEEALRGTPATTVRPTAAAAYGAELAEKPDYRPWGRDHTTVDDVIEVRLKSGEWELVFRPWMVRVNGVGDATLSLLCTSCVIEIHGRHLGELRTLIRSRGVDFIEEFDAERWREPEGDAPRIDRIEVVQARATGPSSPQQSRR